jgi:type III pantothenate kinase
MACIVIDVGNTSTSIGRYEDGAVSRITPIRGGIEHPIVVEAALKRAGAQRADRAVLASVVPATTPRWCWLLDRLFGLETLVLTHMTPMPVGVRYPKPATIGPDRLANACGASVRYGAPAIVADFGTALTFDVLSANNEYVGGVIAPGLPLMTDYLHEKTALLPHIALDGVIEPVGTSTENAMRIGARIGHRGMVREMVNYLRQTTGPEARLCATGGYARWALEGLDMPFHIDPDLTLFGLGTIHDHASNQIQFGTQEIRKR